MNFFTAAEKLAAIDRSKVVLQTQVCLHALGNFSNCQACFTVCPLEAIQASKPPSLDESKCISCLACLPVCPAGAFRADDAIPNLLNCAARLEAKSIELVCENHPQPELGLEESTAAIRIKGCLAGTGSGGYLGLLALGLDKVTVRTDACPDCPLGDLQAQIETQIQSAQKLLAPWKLENALQISGSSEPHNLVERTIWEASNPPLSRRDLFRMATRQGQVAAARMLAADRPSGGKHASRERQRTLVAISHLPEPAAESSKLSLEGMGFGMLQVSETCTACGVCVRACPTGALQFANEADQHYQLTFQPEICNACRACTAVCRAEAIELQDAPTFEHVFGNPGPVLLHSGELARCDHCNTLYAARPGSHLCEICEFRLKNPFGAKMPPGFASGKRLS